ncbi:hypothetical protein M011DRAFT_503801 [Sporormia fimetaria CBS 119925]|uniref:Uncharacterized protein n=1 Tax=Sporormia fimetaria CBS 119925 TaxID=1340428 RepID=A0A6A6VLN5_9PLEO|nr:hypothetical protein M011DRAFT_503801 [Sporormia fimetaria CBS 119925]
MANHLQTLAGWHRGGGPAGQRHRQGVLISDKARPRAWHGDGPATENRRGAKETATKREMLAPQPAPRGSTLHDSSPHPASQRRPRCPRKRSARSLLRQHQRLADSSSNLRSGESACCDPSAVPGCKLKPDAAMPDLPANKRDERAQQTATSRKAKREQSRTLAVAPGSGPSSRTFCCGNGAARTAAYQHSQVLLLISIFFFVSITAKPGRSSSFACCPGSCHSPRPSALAAEQPVA